jgi:hypothetical protein
MIVLEPGESRTYDVEIGVLDGAAEIDRFRACVSAAAELPD